MKHRILMLLSAAMLMLVARPSISHAQTVTFITVDFPFVVEGKPAPAGTYVLRLNPDMSGFTLTQTDTPAPAETIAMETMTRLAAMHPPRGTAHAVFDKKGETYFLSEIWLPDADGPAGSMPAGSRRARPVTSLSPWLPLNRKGRQTHTHSAATSPIDLGEAYTQLIHRWSD